MLENVIEAIRWLLWLLCRASLWFMDSVFKVIKPIITLDIGENKTLWEWWGVLCLFVAFFIICRVVSMYLKATIDEDYLLKLEPMKIVGRIGAVVLVIAIMPMIVRFFTSVSSVTIDKLGELLQSKNNIIFQEKYTEDDEMNEKLKEIYEQFDGLPSQVIIQSMSEGKYPPYQLISINAKTNDDVWYIQAWNLLDRVTPYSVDLLISQLGIDGDYLYFPDTTLLFIVLIESICACFMFVMMGIQVAQRIYSIGFKILMAPYPISGLVNAEDKSFSTWVRLLSADILSNVLQYLLLLFVLMLSSSKLVTDMGMISQIIFFFGGILAVLVGPNSVAQIIGGDGMGVFQTLQGIQTIGTMANLTKGVLGAVGRIGSFAAGAGVYGAGRLMGLDSLGNPPSKPDANAAGGSDNPDSPSGSGGSGAMKKSDPGYYKQPTVKQLEAARWLGISGAEKMSRGQLSEALEATGQMGKSYFKGMGNVDGGANGTIAPNTGNYSMGNVGISFPIDNFGDSSASDTNSDFAGGEPQASSMETNANNNDMSSYNMGNFGDSSASDINSDFAGGEPQFSSIGTNNGEPLASEPSQVSSISANATSQEQSSGTTPNTTDSSSNAEDSTPTKASRFSDFKSKVGNSAAFAYGMNMAGRVGRSLYQASGNRIMGQRTYHKNGRYISRNTVPQLMSNIKHGAIESIKSVNEARTTVDKAPLSTVEQPTETNGTVVGKDVIDTLNKDKI